METAALLFPGSQIQLVDSILETDGGPLSLVPEFYVSNLFGIENTPLRQYPGAESNIAMFNRVLSYHSKLLSSFSQIHTFSWSVIVVLSLVLQNHMV